MKENRYKDRGVLVCETPEQYEIYLKILKQKPLEPRGTPAERKIVPEFWEK